MAKEFQINTNEAGQRLDKYLAKLLPQAGKSFLYKMLRKKNITVNGKKAEGGTHLAVGDRVNVFFSDETFEKFSPGFHASMSETEKIQKPTPFTEHTRRAARIKKENLPKLDVLFEDDDILVINKPAGMLSQKTEADDISVNDLVLQYLLDNGSLTQRDLRTFRPSVCSRLDRNTSGILIAGKSLRGLQEMSRLLRERLIDKYYICIVSGLLTKPANLKGLLIKDEKENKVKVFQLGSAPSTDSRYIETEYRPLRHFGSCTMLEARLITGRSHQIRAHLASIGHPVICDAKYGDPLLNSQFRTEAGIRYQLLHAQRIVFPDGREITAPLPEDFQRAKQFFQIDE